MKKFLIALAVAATVALPVGAAMADPPVDGPPGQGECEHGNSGQTCVPDPQPEHGQECEEHGQEGGVNEDHCLDTTTTSTVSPSPTVTDTTTTTAPTTPPEVTETETTTVPPTDPTTTDSPVESPPSTTGGTPDSPSDTPQDKKQNDTSGPPSKLAFTGVEDVVPIGAAALALLTGGSYLLWRGRKD